MEGGVNLHVKQTIISVSQLNADVKALLEGELQKIWLQGEISNCVCASSGHYYFSLKDDKAQVRCALFRFAARGLKFTPKNGQEVMLQAQVTLYEARGDYQLIVSSMQLAGQGALQIAFEKLKNKLAAETLFDEVHKLPIPEAPNTVGVISSATGAALQDVLTVLKRRFAGIRVIVYPSLVQGDQAVDQLVAAIKTADQRCESDVLVLVRGGGSLEDLWCFNDEKVARAMFHCKIPIVTGVGHEIDFTIADLKALAIWPARP